MLLTLRASDSLSAENTDLSPFLARVAVAQTQHGDKPLTLLLPQALATPSQPSEPVTTAIQTTPSSQQLVVSGY